jgi:benzoyl-CoA-dihydrodiol lyase
MEKSADWYPLRLARELDRAILDLRYNYLDVGLWLLKTSGDPQEVLKLDGFLKASGSDWFVRETLGYLRRTFSRLDVSSRSMFAIIEPGSCFAGTLAEIALACDRSYMLIGQHEGDNKTPATVALSALNFGAYPMSNDLTRLQSRFLGEPARVEEAKAKTGAKLDGADAEALGLVTFAPDDIDWDDEIRVFMEERLSFSPDALTGMEANLRFGGPETMETKIFARLTAWQNWIFQRPNAVGNDGALKRYGTGQKAAFDMRRV